MKRNDREPGGPLTAHERALVARLCSGTWPGASEARAQAASARWGGWQHDECECFYLQVPHVAGLPRIQQHPGGPFASIEVVHGGTLLGNLELWVQEGHLHSVDYITVDAPDEQLPTLDHVEDPPFAPWLSLDTGAQ